MVDCIFWGRVTCDDIFYEPFWWCREHLWRFRKQAPSQEQVTAGVDDCDLRWTPDTEALSARSVRRDGGGRRGSHLDGVNGGAIAGLADERLLSLR